MTTYASFGRPRRAFIDALAQAGCGATVTRAELLDVAASLGKSGAPTWITNDPDRRAGRAQYSVNEILESPFYGADASAPSPVDIAAPVVAAPITVPATMSVMGLTGGERTSLIPEKIDTYVPFGFFKNLEKILKSGMFYPCFVTGMSGNGKTCMVDQVCAKLKRDLYRVNITCQTDEDDLLGGFRLIDGNTVWQDGPVVAAMETGAVLLLDEIDLASHAIMCLQPVLEGKGVFLKKVNRWVAAKPGFTIIATANTKGKGSDDGRFIGTNVLNEAFLDRFPITIEQEYPTRGVETKILKKNFDKLGIDDDGGFGEHLIRWAEYIRKAFTEGSVDEIISTRRLVNIVTAFAIFGDRMTAIGAAISRFDDDTKESFLNLYSKVDADVSTSASDTETVESTTSADDDCPF